MTPHRPARRPAMRAAVALLAAAALVLAACGDDDTDDAADTEAAAPAAEVEVTDAWARTSPRVANAGAVYMQIANGGDLDDALVGVSVEEAVAATAELHETAVVDDDGMDDDGMDDDDNGMDDGMMEMRPVDRIDVPAGGSVTLEPGGHHVMLLELASPLEAGSTIEVTLVFAESGDQVVTVDVRDEAP